MIHINASLDGFRDVGLHLWQRGVVPRLGAKHYYALGLYGQVDKARYSDTIDHIQGLWLFHSCFVFSLIISALLPKPGANKIIGMMCPISPKIFLYLRVKDASSKDLDD